MVSGFSWRSCQSCWIDVAHDIRVVGAAAAGLVGGDDDVGAHEGGDADVFDEVVIVAGEDAEFPSARVPRRR